MSQDRTADRTLSRFIAAAIAGLLGVLLVPHVVGLLRRQDAAAVWTLRAFLASYEMYRLPATPADTTSPLDGEASDQ